MGVDYTANFGIGIEVKINEKHLPNLEKFDDGLTEFLNYQLRNTHFEVMTYGDTYEGDEFYCIVLKNDLANTDLNLQPYKDEIYQWLSRQKICEPVGEFNVVGGLYIW